MYIKWDKNAIFTGVYVRIMDSCIIFAIKKVMKKTVYYLEQTGGTDRIVLPSVIGVERYLGLPGGVLRGLMSVCEEVALRGYRVVVVGFGGVERVGLGVRGSDGRFVGVGDTVKSVKTPTKMSDLPANELKMDTIDDIVVVDGGGDLVVGGDMSVILPEMSTNVPDLSANDTIFDEITASKDGATPTSRKIVLKNGKEITLNSKQNTK